MANISIRIDDSLKGLWNINDPIYKALISDRDGTVPGTITKPTDLDIGAIAAMIEYLRLLSLSLRKQIQMDTSTGEFLKYTLETLLQILRLDGESEADWIARAKTILFQPRVSRASIIRVLRPFSSQEPIIVIGNEDAMFADVSFADRYKRESQTYMGDNFEVFPAFAQVFESSFYSIVIILYDTDPADLYEVVDILSNYVAAGIHYTIEIRSS